MQTLFYTSGFFYNLKNHQIFLLESKQKDNESVWSMFGGESAKGEEAADAFQRIVKKLLNINLEEKNVCPVYDYFHNTRNKLHYVFYVEVGNSRNFKDLKKITAWFTFSDALKLTITSQTKQDIVVGERVINAKWRDDEAKRNPLIS